MKTEFTGTQGELEASGLFVRPIGKHPIGQAFVIDFKHDIGGRSIPDVQGAAYAKLWSASPDLLEALQNILDYPEEDLKEWSELENTADNWVTISISPLHIKAAQNAIKKALNL